MPRLVAEMQHTVRDSSYLQSQYNYSKTEQTGHELKTSLL